MPQKICSSECIPQFSSCCNFIYVVMDGALQNNVLDWTKDANQRGNISFTLPCVDATLARFHSSANPHDLRTSSQLCSQKDTWETFLITEIVIIITTSKYFVERIMLTKSTSCHRWQYQAPEATQGGRRQVWCSGRRKGSTVARRGLAGRGRGRQWQRKAKPWGWAAPPWTDPWIATSHSLPARWLGILHWRCLPSVASGAGGLAFITVVWWVHLPHYHPFAPLLRHAGIETAGPETRTLSALSRFSHDSDEPW